MGRNQKMNNTSEIISQGFYNKCTFWKLISTYRIEIPIIQRDYAQGRLSESASAIRSELLESIYDALVYDSPLDFDFVYGSVEGDKMFPLDGQQRLTTFYLLHWYLSQKENKVQETKATLAKFSYSTRISSRDFCEMLVNLDYTPIEGVSVSSYVKNQNKYFRSWNNDPTIKAMLVMLDEIHTKFFKCEPLLDKLLDDDLEMITFSYLPMEHYSLTDDLYIKMNARGKALSMFENFKAKFIQHLRERSLPYHHFEESIDGRWTDLLWDYRSANNTIDDRFIDLFSYCTEMIFLLCENPRDCESPFRYYDKSVRIRRLVDYYDSEEKVNLLYSLMDLWTGKDEAQNYLASIFCLDRTNGKVRLFDGNVDIFSDVVNGKPVTVTNKILLFAIMHRLIKLGKDTDIAEMIDYARIVRNFLIKVRSFNTGKGTFVPDFRFGRNGIPYTSFISTFLADSTNPYQIIQADYSNDYDGVNVEIYKQESKKAKIILSRPELKNMIQGLEDLSIFKGSIFNVLDYAVANKDDNFIEDMEKLFDRKNSDHIISALLSISNYGIKLGSSFLGDRFFFGNKDGWYEIVTYSGGINHTKFIAEFLNQYYQTKEPSDTIHSALDKIAAKNLPLIDKDDWRYCLVKYPATIRENTRITNTTLAFIFESYGKRTILHRMNGKTLNNIHVVPEYIEVSHQLGNECLEDIYGQNSDILGCIKLKECEGFSITLDKKSSSPLLKNDNAENDQLCQTIIEKYNDSDTGSLDRVEQLMLMVNIVKEIVATSI